jgi:CheY-like chemotaxis protein
MSAEILVVDDEAEIREMLSRHFRYLGYKVELAANGKDALEQLEKKKFDILISDIMMPEMNGVELLRSVRSEYPMLRPIMITGYVTLENALACIRYGADSCVFKPLYDLTVLEKAVDAAVAKSKYWMEILKELRGLK